MVTLSEEMRMFLEVGRIVSTQRELAENKMKLKRHAVSDICGSATENVIRNHLLSKGLNISRPRVYVTPSWMEIDMLSLKPDVDSSKTEYSPAEVKTVIEIKNNAVADQTTVIRKNFDRLRKISNTLKFAAIVLSERDGYKYAIKEEALGYPVFTLILRKVSAGRWMWSEAETIEVYNKIMLRGEWAGKNAMRETGQWNKLVNYLSS
jgi:hypothetical protein